MSAQGFGGIRLAALDQNPSIATEYYRESTFGLSGILFLYLLLVFPLGSISWAHRSWLGETHFVNYGLYDSPIAVLLVVIIAVWQRPKVLFLSRWIPRLTDLAVGIPAAALIAFTMAWSFPRGLVPGPTYSMTHALIPIVVMAPIAEELLFRGIFLRSLEECTTSTWAILIVTVLAGIGHSWIWFALGAQLALSIIYVLRGNSIAASIIFHATFNLCIFLNIERLARH